MVNKLRNYIRYKKAKQHVKKLYQLAEIGRGFCTSPMYPNRLLHLYRYVKIINNSKKERAITIGDNCNISCSMITNKEGKIDIGDFVYMNSGCSLNISNNLTIGNNILFGPNVKIWDSSNHPLDAHKRYKQTMKIPNQKSLNSFHIGGGNITIKNNVWIGMDVLILGNVTIGENAVVAARSVVTKNIEANCLYAGIPAKKIKKI
jgi:acetyltransferase-like isoleucine patch superfamily enzyme